MADPDAVPPGANRADCRSVAHPDPVVLINGTFTVMESDFGALAPQLANAGYCVYTFNYGQLYPGSFIGAVGPVTASARQLATVVEQVRVETKAQKVDLVGHSQGGLLAEYYVKLLGGAASVRTVVGLSPTTHGTTLGNLLSLVPNLTQLNAFIGLACQACVDQQPDSVVIRALDQGPIAQAGVAYTVIETRNETVVTPVGSAFVEEPGVTNEYVQGFCPADSVDHGNLPYDNTVFRLVENALDPAHAKRPDCALAYPAAAR